MSPQQKSARQPKGSRHSPGQANSKSVRFAADQWDALCGLPETVGWEKNAVVYRVIFRKRDDGWQALVKASRGKEFGITYIDGRSFFDMLEILTLKLSEGRLNWSKDKHAG